MNSISNIFGKSMKVKTIAGYTNEIRHLDRKVNEFIEKVDLVDVKSNVGGRSGNMVIYSIYYYKKDEGMGVNIGLPSNSPLGTGFNWGLYNEDQLVLQGHTINGDRILKNGVRH